MSNALKVIKLTFVSGAVGLPNQLYQARQAQSFCNPTPIVVAAIIAAVAVGPIVESAGNRALAGRR
jgi:polar amino acid transport system permease protein